MLKRFPVFISIIVLLCLFSFVVAAEYTEPESFSFEETSSLAMETSSTFAVLISTDTSSEETSETSTVFSTSDEQATIINRLDMIYTLGLFIVGVFASLLVIFVLWRVLDVFLFSS